MARLMQLALFGIAVLALSGCGMTGKWTLDTIDPESARGHFRLASVTLNSDGTYIAESAYDGKKETSTGKYTYKDDTLTFTPEKGEPRSYDAELIEMHCKLRVKTSSQHGDVTAIMKRN